ncbi:MAG: amidohydrolase/deacetylase family metallohydrolase, partial [Microbacterium sp.]
MTAANAPIVLRGGLVHDPETGTAAVRDIRIADGLFSPEPLQRGDKIIDASGYVVTAGLVDLHTHVFAGQDLGVSADDVAFGSGVTTMIDAGSAGAHLI